MPEKKKKDLFKLITPEFRGSYVNLEKSRSIAGDDPYFGLNITLPKDHSFWVTVDDLIEKAAIAKWGEVPEKLSLTRKDGDAAGNPDEWKGCYSIPANTKAANGAPDLVKQGEPAGAILPPGEFYSGAWFRATVRVAAYTYGGVKKGVSLYLQNVMKVRDDKPFSGKSTGAEDFAQFLDTEGTVDPMG